MTRMPAPGQPRRCSPPPMTLCGPNYGSCQPTGRTASSSAGRSRPLYLSLQPLSAPLMSPLAQVSPLTPVIGFQSVWFFLASGACLGNLNPEPICHEAAALPMNSRRLSLLLSDCMRGLLPTGVLNTKTDHSQSVGLQFPHAIPVSRLTCTQDSIVELVK